jgi:phosphotriesterase-related protein
MEQQTTKPMIMTVTGPVPPEALGITDGHTHTWIEPVAGTRPGLPVLNDQPAITAELIEFRESGGGSLVDCQPGGCGRNGTVMSELSQASGVRIVGCTGFHRRQYYPADAWIYRPTTGLDDAKDYFVEEITVAMRETQHSARLVRAGFIKIACEADINQVPAHLIEAAAQAGVETGVAIEVHTEKGADAEKIAQRFEGHGLPLSRLILCHIDKRPDFALHAELAQAGVTLEYDTFYRAKYQPEQNVWPLLEQMVAAGLASQVIIATDMAEAAMWRRLGGEPGQTAFTSQILPRLQSLGIDAVTIQQLLGKNIARLLAYPATGDQVAESELQGTHSAQTAQ